MKEAKQNLCPLLKSVVCPLSQEDYDKVTGVLKVQRKEQKVALDEARQEAVEGERRRSQSLVERQTKEIDRLQETVKHLKEGTTPQSVGYADEGLLVVALQEYFPEDDVQHKGKKGDVLHIIKAAGKQVGSLVYECKRTQSLTKAHIRQAYKAKVARQADEVILVTTGRRKGFSGFGEDGGVYIIAPAGVLAFVSYLRQSLIALKQANLTEDAKATVLNNLRIYTTVGKFPQAMSDILQRETMLEKQLQDEVRAHYHFWQERVDHYHHIGFNAEMVQKDIKCLLLGGWPEEITCPTPPMLQLMLPDEE